MSEPVSSSSTLQQTRASASLRMLFIGDALSMPVHWYYRPADILRAFPPHGVTRMHAPPLSHPSSIMSLHSTSKGGRGEQTRGSGQIVGDVILKDKARFWGQPNMHYHQGMSAGDNTLNACCARLLMNWLSAGNGVVGQQYELESWLQHYVEFMTAEPPAHPDTYAESWHRGFFANREAGLPLQRCGAKTHDTPSMGALVTIAPLALALLPSMPLPQVQAICREHVYATHPDDLLMQVVDSYVSLMSQLLFRDEADDDCSSLFAEAAKVVRGGNIDKLLSTKAGDAAVVGGRYSLACYITDSWPSVCYLAAKYYQQPDRALLINTNLGGENAHRGSVLGTLVGLASASYSEGFFSQMPLHLMLEREISVWQDYSCPVASC